MLHEAQRSEELSYFDGPRAHECHVVVSPNQYNPTQPPHLYVFARHIKYPEMKLARQMYFHDLGWALGTISLSKRANGF